MNTTMNQIKNHPGFMPFGCSGVKSSTEQTQFEREQEKSQAEKASDSAKSN